jgi:hypothetical protein
MRFNKLLADQVDRDPRKARDRYAFRLVKVSLVMLELPQISFFDGVAFPVHYENGFAVTNQQIDNPTVLATASCEKNFTFRLGRSVRGVGPHIKREHHPTRVRNASRNERSPVIDLLCGIDPIDDFGDTKFRLRQTTFTGNDFIEPDKRFVVRLRKVAHSCSFGYGFADSRNCLMHDDASDLPN